MEPEVHAGSIVSFLKKRIIVKDAIPLTVYVISKVLHDMLMPYTNGKHIILYVKCNYDLLHSTIL